jgi:hypothetical protein
MAPRGQRIELTKPVLSQGTIGVTPFNAISLSYLLSGQAQCIIRFKDMDNRLPEGELNAEVPAKAGKWEKTDLQGRLFNGYADAFYRGRLPEVILCFVGIQSMSDFWEDLTGYLEQMLSLGFLGHEPVKNIMPYMVILGDGMRFSRIITALTRYLDAMSHSYPVLDLRTRGQILSRFLRALPDLKSSTEWHDSDWNLLACHNNLHVKHVPETLTLFQLVSGTLSSWEQVRDCLSLNSIRVQDVDQAVPMNVERLELQQTWQRLSTVILPGLAQQQDWTKAFTQEVMSRTQAGLLEIGRACHAVRDSESVDTVFQKTGKLKKSSEQTMNADSRESRLLLQELVQVAQALPQAEKPEVFSELLKNLP